MNCCIENAIDGDPTATEELVEELRPRIASMAGYYARCTGEDPDDLLQEAWVGLLQALPELNTCIGSPEQYLIRHARWRLLDAVKRARVRRCAPLDDFTDDCLPHPAPESAIESAFVSEFAERLKESQRAVLGCLMDGLTWREAGEALGCTSANVAYHVRQIKRQYAVWAEE